ncbi:MAG: hypothetical protein Q9181_001085 [Wetmoreana brouardii]
MVQEAIREQSGVVPFSVLTQTMRDHSDHSTTQDASSAGTPKGFCETRQDPSIATLVKRMLLKYSLSKNCGDLSKTSPQSPPLPNSVSQKSPIPADSSVPTQNISLSQPEIEEDGHPLSRVPSHWSAINLQGLDQGCHKPKDFCRPFIRDFPKHRRQILGCRSDQNHQTPVIEPIDTVTVWKGLALNDCEDLLFIQGYLKVCLEQLLEDQLTYFRAWLSDDWRCSHKQACASADCTETFVFHRFIFKKSRLVEAVCEALDASANVNEPDDNRALRDLLMMYLWSRDCLLDLPNKGPDHSAIHVRLRCHMNLAACLPSLSITAAMWVPDYIAFERLVVLPQEGSQVVLKPYYRSNVRQQVGDPHTQVTYSLGANHPWLSWDAEAGAFRGQIPFYSQKANAQKALGRAHPVARQNLHAAVHVVSIEVRALAVVAYPGSTIRLERTIRTRVTLRVLPTPSIPGPLTSSVNSPRSQVRCKDPVKSRGPTTSSFKSQAIGSYHNNGRLESPAIIDATLPSFLHQFDRVEKIKKEPTSNTKSPDLRLSLNEAGADNASLAKGSEVLQPSTEAHGHGLEALPNGPPLPLSSGKKKSLTRRAYSNTPGIDLKALALIESCLNDHELKAEEPEAFINDEHGEAYNVQEDRHDEEAEVLDAQYSPNTPKKRISANGSPRSRGPGMRAVVAGTVQTPRSKRPPHTLPSSSSDHPVDNPQSGEYGGIHANQRKTEATRNCYKAASINRPQTPSLKTPTFEESSTIVQSQDCNGYRFHSVQITMEEDSPSSTNSAAKRLWISPAIIISPSEEDDYPLQPPEKLSASQSFISPYNTFALLRDIMDDSRIGSSSNESGSDRSLPLATQAAQVPSNAGSSSIECIPTESLVVPTADKRYIDWLCGDAGEDSDSSFGSESSSRTLRSLTACGRCSPKVPDSHDYQAAGSWTMPPYTISMDDEPMYVSYRDVSRGIIPRTWQIDVPELPVVPPCAPLGHHRSGTKYRNVTRNIEQSSNSDDGRDPPTRKEKMAFGKVINSREARRSIREPGLTREEKGHIFNALTKSIVDKLENGDYEVALSSGDEADVESEMDSMEEI